MWRPFSLSLLQLLLLLLMHCNRALGNHLNIICTMQCTCLIGSLERRGNRVLFSLQTFEASVDVPLGLKEMMTMKLREVRTSVLVRMNRRDTSRKDLGLALASVPFKRDHNTTFVFGRDGISPRFEPHQVSDTNEPEKTYDWKVLDDLVALLGDQWKQDELSFTNLVMWVYVSEVFWAKWLKEEQSAIRLILGRQQKKLPKQNFYWEFEVENCPMCKPAYLAERSKIFRDGGVADDKFAKTILGELVKIQEAAASKLVRFMSDRKQYPKKLKTKPTQPSEEKKTMDSFWKLRIAADQVDAKLLVEVQPKAKPKLLIQTEPTVNPQEGPNRLDQAEPIKRYPTRDRTVRRSYEESSMDPNPKRVEKHDDIGFVDCAISADHAAWFHPPNQNSKHHSNLPSSQLKYEITVSLVPAPPEDTHHISKRAKSSSHTKSKIKREQKKPDTGTSSSAAEVFWFDGHTIDPRLLYRP